MNAEEIFKQLGFMEVKEHTSMFAIKVYKKGLNYIYFDYDGNIDIGCLIITPQLLKAINRQVEEFRQVEELRQAYE